MNHFPMHSDRHCCDAKVFTLLSLLRSESLDVHLSKYFHSNYFQLFASSAEWSWELSGGVSSPRPVLLLFIGSGRFDQIPGQTLVE
jgi:hypothetical protein